LSSTLIARRLIPASALFAGLTVLRDLRIHNVRFREATIDDCMSVAGVHVRSWQESFAGIVPQAFLDKMSVEKRARAFEEGFRAASYKMYVAEVPESGVIGFADRGEPRDNIGRYAAELYAIYLLPEFQRRGIGENLFKLVVESFVREGRCSMYLYALEVSPYRTFYEKMNGRVVGRKRREIEGIPFDELVYGWDCLC
jgi:GNAT superfamily N-acetyltransferase